MDYNFNKSHNTNNNKNLESIIGEAGTAPNEFNSPEMHKFAEKHGIAFHYSQPNEINNHAIVERFNRTIPELQ